MEGRVRWFSRDKGYGFIASDDGGADLFVHHTQIRTEDQFKTLEEGQKVSFTPTETSKGRAAEDVHPL